MTAQVIIQTHGSPPRRAALVTLFAVVATMAFGGVLLSAVALGGASHTETSSHVLAVGEPAATSFGSLTIQRVQTLDGLDPPSSTATWPMKSRTWSPRPMRRSSST